MERANYTEWFCDYLDDIGGKNELINILGETLSNITDFNNESFIDRFILKYKYREIGAETYTLFTHNLEMCARECSSMFIEKIKMQKENFNKLYDRTYEEETKETNKMYLNPVTTTAPKLSDMTEKEQSKTRQFGFIYNNAKLMEQVNQIEMEFEKALNYFEKVFMGII